MTTSRAAKSLRALDSDARAPSRSRLASQVRLRSASGRSIGTLAASESRLEDIWKAALQATGLSREDLHLIRGGRLLRDGILGGEQLGKDRIVHVVVKTAARSLVTCRVLHPETRQITAGPQLRAGATLEELQRALAKMGLMPKKCATAREIHIIVKGKVMRKHLRVGDYFLGQGQPPLLRLARQPDLGRDVDIRIHTPGAPPIPSSVPMNTKGAVRLRIADLQAARRVGIPDGAQYDVHLGAEFGCQCLSGTTAFSDIDMMISAGPVDVFIVPSIRDLPVFVPPPPPPSFGVDILASCAYLVGSHVLMLAAHQHFAAMQNETKVEQLKKIYGDKASRSAGKARGTRAEKRSMPCPQRQSKTPKKRERASPATSVASPMQQATPECARSLRQTLEESKAAEVAAAAAAATTTTATAPDAQRNRAPRGTAATPGTRRTPRPARRGASQKAGNRRLFAGLKRGFFK